MKFEFVKEVIARGVTLRRCELWKKIRQGEEKPETISDRTWRTLGRQLDNPASVRKSENCRRANASRVNFGRTGPSGEVGVRLRLKRKLRRSPYPEEVMYEMARNKGSGDRKRSKEEKNDFIMHGSERPRQLTAGVANNTASSNSSEENKSTENEDNEPAEDESEDRNGRGLSKRRSRQMVVPGTVS